eukprot:GHUV01039454.1.p2 GENE.GHUV01039454.1~~GHUV01039454.1.p2  ORF type:complete len:107 (+),score=13.09 GHUV01039454.1:889-1209(+)
MPHASQQQAQVQIPRCRAYHCLPRLLRDGCISLLHSVSNDEAYAGVQTHCAPHGLYTGWSRLHAFQQYLLSAMILQDSCTVFLGGGIQCTMAFNTSSVARPIFAIA